ncbi:MAG: sugar phosphate isomerase/epimerase [Candidatus Hydrogenedentes bacterium]|nr:sugar phosphate isomerase/epimerase [Candidatus Hydrogenedentota bacterium]
MNTISRRHFLGSVAAGLPLTAYALRSFSAEGAEFILGSQSYSFRNFDTENALDQLQQLGLSYMEFCAVHFPPDPANPKLEEIKALIAAKGITVPAYGVEGFSADAEANRKKFEFAKAMGIAILTADPSPDSFDNLDALTQEFSIAIAIHNHGPGARYDKVDDTLRAVAGRNPLIGACLDTGHCIRSGEKPHEVIKQLGGRLICMHLKDWVHGGAEQIVGKGDLDVNATVKALKDINFAGPIMLEYEESPDNPVPDMKQGVANWKDAVKHANGAEATTT